MLRFGQSHRHLSCGTTLGMFRRRGVVVGIWAFTDRTGNAYASPSIGVPSQPIRCCGRYSAPAYGGLRKYPWPRVRR